MKLTITEKTKWNEVSPLLSEEEIKKLQKKITALFHFDFYQLTIGDFSEMIEGKTPDKLDRLLVNEIVTVFEVIKLKNAIEKFVKDFSTELQSYEIKSDPIATANLPQFNLIQSMLIFTRSYFGLHNFGDAEKITLLEFSLAKRHTYAQQIFEKNLTNELNRKSRKSH